MNQPHISATPLASRYLTERQCFSRIGGAYVALYAVTMAVQFAAMLLMRLLDAPALRNTSLMSVISMAAMYLIGVPVTVLLMHRIPARAPVRHRPSARMLLTCLLIGIALMYLGSFVGDSLMSGINNLFGTSSTNDLDTVANETGPLIWTLSILLAAPVFEELLFRKLLIDRVRQFGDLPAVLLSGLMFGLFHGNFYQFFYAAAIGFLLAYLYLRTGLLRYNILLHMGINVVGGVLAPAMQNPSQWMPSFPGSRLLSGVLSYGFSGLLFLCVIGGVVLLINDRRRIYFLPPECPLPSDRLRTVIATPGMIAFLAVTLGTFLFDIFF